AHSRKAVVATGAAVAAGFRVPPNLHMYARMAAEQHHQNKDDHDQPNQAVTAAPVIATAVSVVSAAAAEQQNEHDKQDEQAHGELLSWQGARSRWPTHRTTPGPRKRFPQPMGAWRRHSLRCSER